jgi:hypothetical protein
MFRYVLSLGLIALMAMTAGCLERVVETTAAPGISAEETAEIRSQLLVAVAPPAAKSVIEVRDLLADAKKGQTPDQVSVIGQIGGMPNPYGDDVQPEFPWVNGEAVFFLVDPTTAAEFEGHQHEKGEECSFCMGKARDLVDTVAMVRLHGGASGSIPARADVLLGLGEGDTVVVTGTARDELGMLVVDAKGVHVSPPAPSAVDEPEVVDAEDEAKVP